LHDARGGEQRFLAGEAQQDRKNGIAEPGRDRIDSQRSLQAFSGLFDNFVGRSYVLAYDAQVIQRNQHHRDGLSISGGGDQHAFQMGEKVRPIVQAAHGVPIAEG